MDQEYINRVEAYIHGGLNAEEKRQFDKEIADNDELAAVYREYVLAMDAIDQKVESELRQEFKRWNHNGRRAKSTQIFPLLWKFAASFVLLIGLYLVFFQYANEFDNTLDLALNEYKLPPSPGRKMGETDQLWNKGLDAYTEHKFQEAIDIWSDIENPGVEAQYYLAHAYFNVRNYSEAILLFKSLSESSHIYTQQSDWFLLLAYLAADDQYGLTGQMEKITGDTRHLFYNNVQELRKDIRKLKERK